VGAKCSRHIRHLSATLDPCPTHDDRPRRYIQLMIVLPEGP
jgi:hypothetical protein